MAMLLIFLDDESAEAFNFFGCGLCLITTTLALPMERKPLVRRRWCGLATHAMRGGVGTKTGHLPHVAVAVQIASDDAANFPPLQRIKKRLPTSSYLAHKHRVNAVGGG